MNTNRFTLEMETMATPKKASKKTVKSKSANTTGNAPQIDTALAAASAASALVSRAKIGAAASLNLGTAVKSGAQSGAESAAFKKMKVDAAKPALPTNMPFGNPASTKHAGHGNAFGPRQVGHNQVQTGGGARTGVPRRTAGG